MRSFILIALLCELAVVYANVKFIFPKGSSNAYQGFAFPNSEVVQLDIHAVAQDNNGTKNGTICGITTHHQQMSDFPFIIDLLDKENGFAEVRINPKTPLDHTQYEYTFQIEAYSCETPARYSERVLVDIIFRNSSAPVWSHKVYKILLNEASPAGTQVAQVQAYPSPSDDGQSAICQYAIIFPEDSPFSIDQSGVIRTKRTILASHQASDYELRVRATDCNTPQPRSSVVKAVVSVSSLCRTGWSGVPDIIEYSLSSGLRSLFLEPLRLDTCGSCTDPQITATLLLKGGPDQTPPQPQREETHVRETDPDSCRQDPDSLRLHNSVCGTASRTVNLLPSPEDFVTQPHGSGRAMRSNSALEFDGQTTFTVVPTSKFPDNHQMGNAFTIAFWMLHGPMPTHNKEQILCNADSDGMNRHHFSLFLHNCKLIVLLRREYDPVNRYTASPAEWRFGPLEEVCESAGDNQKWHHYALSYLNGKMSLIMDGQKAAEPEVIDDLPMHDAATRVHSTKLTVGACYLGRNKNTAQHLKGYLTGLTVLRNTVESPSVLKCLGRCGESVFFPHIAQFLESGTAVSLAFNEVKMIGPNSTQLATMMSKIAYANLRANSIQPGHYDLRSILLSTSILCREGRMQPIPTSTITIKLLAEQPPVLMEISADKKITGSLSQDAALAVFPNVKFVNQEIDESVDQVEVDSCVIRAVDGILKHDEALLWPVSLVRTLGLVGLNNSYGLVLEGTATVDNYRQILQQIIYKRIGGSARTIAKRRIGVACSYGPAKTVTREYIVTLLPISPVDDDSNRKSNKKVVIIDQTVDYVKEHSGQANNHGKGMNKHHLTSRMIDSKSRGTSTSVLAVGIVGALVIMVCFILALVIVIKVYRQKYNRTERQKHFNERMAANICNGGESGTGSLIETEGVRPYGVINPMEDFVDPEDGQQQISHDADSDDGSMEDLPLGHDTYGFHSGFEDEDDDDYSDEEGRLNGCRPVSV